MHRVIVRNGCAKSWKPVSARAELFYQELDGLQALSQEVRRDLLAESRKHGAAKLLRYSHSSATGGNGSSSMLDA
jgi:hypothetical protein